MLRIFRGTSLGTSLRSYEMKPSDFPPPFSFTEAIAPPTDPEDERIEVGVAIVGAGPAGLACAIRLGQLLADAPAVAERLGEVPVAVIEKGKQPGSHLLSGAVVNPRALQRLFAGRKRLDDLPFYGPVEQESVYFLTRNRAVRIPTPPTMKNHGNRVASLAQLGRWLADQAEEAGAMILPETAATKLLVDHGRVRGIRTGDEMLTLGMVVGLDYRDVELSVHDLLQELKTHRLVRRLLEGGERIAWGAKTIPEGGFLSLPKRLHAPGLLLAGDGPGFVNVPALKGIHYAIETGSLAAEAAFAALQRGESPGRREALAPYDEAVRQSFVWRDLEQVRNMRQAFGRGFWLGGAMAGAMTASRGKFPPGDARTEPDAAQELIRTDRAKSYPAPDGKLTFDKLSSVFLSGNKTRDDAPNHIRVQTAVAPELAQMWARRCPAQVYDATDGRVEVTASNCVQCGAITAKGGRLTPAEGGSGPEYTLT